MTQEAGHFGKHSPPSQASVDWQPLLSFAVQATHLCAAVLHTWWEGSHAAQSAFVLHVTVGSPFAVGHVALVGTQLPWLEHFLPLGQPVLLAASHATQRCSPARQVLRPSEQAWHSKSALQFLSRQS